MENAVIGATGRVGSEVVRGLLASEQIVTAPVRDASKARQMFGPAENLDIRETDLENLAEVRTALCGRHPWDHRVRLCRP